MSQTVVPQVLNRHKIIASLSAGALAGALAKTVIAPLDRCKVNFQVSQQQYSYRAAWRFLLDTYRNEGFFGLWRGNLATMYRVIPFAGIQFCSYEQWKSLLNVDTGHHTPFRRFLAGSLAGVTATTLTYPLDLARAKLSVAPPKSKYKSLTSVFVAGWRKERSKSLHKGISPTFLGVIPYAGTSFCVYDTCKLYYQEKIDKHVEWWERLLFGALAGSIGQITSYPLSIVRRRMQTSMSLPPKTRIITIICNVIAHEGGFQGLYKGVSMNYIKGPIASGISYTLFDIMYGDD